MVQNVNFGIEESEFLAKQFHTLYSSQDSEKIHQAQYTTLRPDDQQQRVHFEESLFLTSDEKELEGHIATKFADEPFVTYSVTLETPSPQVIDCSHIHFSTKNLFKEFPGFCVDIGAPDLW